MYIDKHDTNGTKFLFILTQNLPTSDTGNVDTWQQRRPETDAMVDKEAFPVVQRFPLDPFIYRPVTPADIESNHQDDDICTLLI